MSDYYKLLGVDRKATRAEVKKNYRRLATKYHPDKNSDPDAATKFIAITEAYDVLSDKRRRVQYDLLMYEIAVKAREKAEHFTVVVPPELSTRARRNKAQKERSLKYHQLNNKNQKRLSLISEGLRISSRYFVHLIGLSLLAVILPSAISQMSDAFAAGALKGVALMAFVMAMVYVLYRVLENAFEELKKDTQTFATYYQIRSQQASLLIGLALVISVSLAGSILYTLSS